MSVLLSIDSIRELLPHRYPFLMVDKVLELEEGQRIVAVENVTINEPEVDGDVAAQGELTFVLSKRGDA
jgi:hypothetical protein